MSTAFNRLAATVSFICSCLCLSIYAQSSTTEFKQFVAGGISFDFPAGYSVRDESNEKVQHLILSRQGSSVQLEIVAGRAIVIDELGNVTSARAVEGHPPRESNRGASI